MTTESELVGRAALVAAQVAMLLRQLTDDPRVAGMGAAMGAKMFSLMRAEATGTSCDDALQRCKDGFAVAETTTVVASRHGLTNLGSNSIN